MLLLPTAVVDRASLPTRKTRKKEDEDVYKIRKSKRKKARVAGGVERFWYEQRSVDLVVFAIVLISTYFVIIVDELYYSSIEC